MINEKVLIEELKKRIASHEKDADDFAGETIYSHITETLLRIADETQAVIELVEKQPKVNCSDCSRRQFYQKGYQDGLNANKWIPCSERLPEGCDDAEIVVLATVKADESEMSLDTDDRVVPALYYPLTKHFYTGWNRLKITRDVIAWMYLPEPYKEEVNQ